MMKALLLGGTGFISRRIAELLHEGGNEVLIVHRGLSEPENWITIQHIHAHRHDLASQHATIRAFRPDVIIDANAYTGEDVDLVTPLLPDVPVVVLSSQDVYQAISSLREGRNDVPVPLFENSELRRNRYPYRGKGYAGIPEDYEKIDVEERWLKRNATVLRLPMVYGAHDDQKREDVILKRAVAGRTLIPIGVGTLLWTRGHVDDIARAVLAALTNRAADGQAVNIGEKNVLPIQRWYQQILDAANSAAQFVRVADEVVPDDLSLSRNHRQHMIASVQRAEDLLGWSSTDSETMVPRSIKWHLTQMDSAKFDQEAALADDLALATAESRP